MCLNLTVKLAIRYTYIIVSKSNFVRSCNQCSVCFVMCVFRIFFCAHFFPILLPLTLGVTISPIGPTSGTFTAVANFFILLQACFG